MVSISIGNKFKSNFSEAQKSYQMTISLIMMVLMLCAISSIATLNIMNKPEPTKPGTKPTTVAVKNANGIPKPKIANIPKKPKLESPPPPPTPSPSKTLPPPTPSPSKTLPPPPPKGPKGQQPKKPIPSQLHRKDGKFVEISLDDLTDEQYEEFDSFYRSYNKDNYPNRFKRQELRRKINMVKKKEIYAYLPGHSKSHNMDVVSGDPGFWGWQKDETQKVTEEDAKNWLDTNYVKRNRDGSHSTAFPYHTLAPPEILKLAQDRLERIGINTSTRNKYKQYGFDDRTGECHKYQPCDYDGYTGMKPEIADFYKPCYDTDKYSSDKEREKCLYPRPRDHPLAPYHHYSI